MNKVIRSIGIALSAVIAVSCSQSGQASSASTSSSYKISPDLAGIKRERSHYGAVGDTMSVSLPYIVQYVGEEKNIPPRILVVNVTRRIGGKFDRKFEGVVVAVIDGRGRYDCGYFFNDIPSGKLDADIPELQCLIDAVGEVPLKRIVATSEQKN